MLKPWETGACFHRIINTIENNTKCHLEPRYLIQTKRNALIKQFRDHIEKETIEQEKYGDNRKDKNM